MLVSGVLADHLIQLNKQQQKNPKKQWSLKNKEAGLEMRQYEVKETT